ERSRLSECGKAVGWRLCRRARSTDRGTGAARWRRSEEGGGRELDVGVRPRLLELRLELAGLGGLLLAAQRLGQPEQAPPVARVLDQIGSIRRLRLLVLLVREQVRALVVAHRVV